MLNVTISVKHSQNKRCNIQMQRKFLLAFHHVAFSTLIGKATVVD